MRMFQFRPLLAIGAIAAALTVSVAIAQQRQEGQRLNGTIERVESNTIYAKANDGSTITIKLADKATVTAVFKATVADQCGQWPRDLAIGSGADADWSNKPYWNFGCAYQSAFAAQVADPRDLVAPQAETAVSLS